MGQREDSEGDAARPGLSSPQWARDVEAQRPHICQCAQPALPPSTRSQPPSTTQALSKAPSCCTGGPREGWVTNAARPAASTSQRGDGRILL